MKKILFMFGTRPEAIKFGPLVNIFKKNNTIFESKVIVTGQHREMLDQVLSIFNIIPDYDLKLMSINQSLEQLTSKILVEASDLILKLKPNLVFVQGDTTTTLAVSMAAFYQKVKVAHIEAGLRTNNIYSPFPEEINRRITSSIATFHFAPTKEAANNLLNEGINKNNIVITGNTVIDSLLSISKTLDNKEYENYFYKNYNINFSGKKTILITGHRRESFGEGFNNICDAVKYLSRKKNVQFIYPVHLNPNVQGPVNDKLKNLSNVYLIPPQDYVPFIFLMKSSYIVLTDSGGVQEEAPSLGKPVLVMRDLTERVEGVKAGTAKLVGTNKDKIISEVSLLLDDINLYNKMSKNINPYGNGDASLKIFNYLKNNI